MKRIQMAAIVVSLAASSSIGAPSLDSAPTMLDLRSARTLRLPVTVIFDGKTVPANVEVWRMPAQDPESPVKVASAALDENQPQSLTWSDTNEAYSISIVARGGTCTIQSQPTMEESLFRQTVVVGTGNLVGSMMMMVPISSGSSPLLPAAEIRLVCNTYVR